MMMNSRQAGLEIRRLLASGEVGFLACAMSHWHAMGVDAMVHSLRASGDHRRGTVILLPHIKDGLLINEDCFPLCQADGRVDFLGLQTLLLRGGARQWLEAAGAGIRVLRFWLSRPGSKAAGGLPILSVGSPRDAAAGVFMLGQIGSTSLLKKFRIRMVVLDEGLANYKPYALRNDEARLERPTHGRIASAGWLDALLYSCWHKMHAAIAGSYDLEERLIFRRDPDTGILGVNEKVAADYRQAALAGPSRDAAERAGRPYAIIVTAPYSETGTLDRAVEIELLAAVVDRLIAAGFHVRIKPHPREAQDKYASVLADRSGLCELAPGKHVVERTFANMRGNGIVVGVSSTCLLTASLLYSLKVYSYGEAMFGRAGTSGVFVDVQKSLRAMAGDAVGDFQEEFGPL